MTATGGYPAPGWQDREPPDNWSPAGQLSAAPPPTGRPLPAPAYLRPPSTPQAPMLMAHKPGIVPLRPLQLGDILDGAIKAIRFNPKSMVGLSAIVLAVFLVPSAALGAFATHLSATLLSSQGPAAQAFLGVPAMLLQYVCTTLAAAILSGLLVYAVGQAVLGHKPDIGATWRATRGRVRSLLALLLLCGLFTLVAAALLLAPGVLLLINHSVGAGLVMMFLGLVSLGAVALAVSTKISLAAPAIVLEGHGVFIGLRRSFALTKGAFWRILGIRLLAGLIAGVIGSVLGLPFSIAGTAIAAMSGQGGESGQMITTFVSHLSALLTGTITTPFVAAVTGLLYIDRRMRLEALDVVLLRAAQTNPAPRI
jgi:hypothetical protein